VLLIVKIIIILDKNTLNYYRMNKYIKISSTHINYYWNICLKTIVDNNDCTFFLLVLIGCNYYHPVLTKAVNCISNLK